MIRNRLLSAAFALLILGAFATSTTAQVQRVPNTGCPNAAYPSFTGMPAIGQGFGVIAAPCRAANAQQFIVLGAPGLSAVLAMPPACEARCVLECRPILVLVVSAFRTTIPNDRSLVGAQLCAQSGCVEPVRPSGCINLHGALAISITP